ncbi:metal ABC transporter permease [Yinghuangia sp. YIM S09857]|uniref:metal ABC transporter permease n=1 Tax=Yinghuangia sp. YIM S09857 TaxID=3436929 RepID=UPI003F534FDB
MTWFDSYAHRAYAEAVMIGLLAGVVGVQVVLRRIAFYAMAMTHATFPGVVLASVLGFNIHLGGAIVGIAMSLAIVALTRSPGQTTSGTIGVTLAAGFALGATLVAVNPAPDRKLSAFLVGSIVTVDTQDLTVTAVCGLAVLLVLALLAKEFTFAAFDHDGMRAGGHPVALLDLVLLLLVQVVIVVLIPAVGFMLTLALLVAPAATARLWTDSLTRTTALAATLGVASALGGLEISRRYDVSAGAAIALVAASAFVLSLLLSPHHGVVGRLLGRPAGRTPAAAVG